ncbi:hypothetical protein F2Q70_00030134 [Brassica cretica]|uniref:Uncharacterized protein n=1 Tax=Brassica cretica TaxID=69181 RepID=A0A8S9FJP0_BRACR|nr:hypothetical protein F2Q70_00030134 [Brassica cretica]
MDWCRIDVSEELGRYVATELWLSLGRYVATERDERLIAKLRPSYEFRPQRLAEIGSDLDAAFWECFVETDCYHGFASWLAFFIQGRDVMRLPEEFR